MSSKIDQIINEAYLKCIDEAEMLLSCAIHNEMERIASSYKKDELEKEKMHLKKKISEIRGKLNVAEIYIDKIGS